MFFSFVGDQGEEWLERCGEILGGVATHREARARWRSIFGEPGDNDRTTSPDGVGGESHVAVLIGGVDEKVKHGSVVPQIEASIRFPGHHVIDDEGHRGGPLAQPGLHFFEHS